MAKAITDNIDSFTVASELIYDERTRQCEKGFGPDHDDMHADGSLQSSMKLLAHVASRKPTDHAIISLLSASMPVNVQISP